MKDLIKNYLSSEDDSQNVCIFIGITGAICEALESSSSRIITICQNIQTELYSSKIWTNLSVLKISNFSYELVMKDRGSFIKYPTSANTNILKQIN